MIKRLLLEKFSGGITLGQRFIKNAYYKNQRPQNRSSGVLSYRGCFDGQPVSRLKAASPGSFYTLQTPPFQ